MNFEPFDLITKHGADRIEIGLDKAECEEDLAVFFRRAWPAFDPSAYQHNWHIDAIADHLMAVADGQIRRLLINVPPRCSKTLLCTVAFPDWLWALPTNPEYPLHGPGLRLLCVAYGTTRAKEDAVTSRNLISSEWYQQRWGHHVRIAANRDNSERFDTQMGGSRISVGIEASVLGRGGNLKIIDDAMKPDDPESDLARQGVIRSYDETLSNRENDPRLASEIIVAQRLGELDLPGHVLSKYGSDPDRGGFCHLMIPAEYDSQRHCVTVLGWQDPRGCKKDKAGNDAVLPDSVRKLRDGTSFWEDRFTEEVLDQRKTAEGPYSWAAKYQQAPSPRGGGIIKGEWWHLWANDAFPDFRLVVVSVDTAQTEKEINDESAITVWGVFDGDKGFPQLMLIYAWEGHLEFFQLVSKVTEFCRGTYTGKTKTGPKADVCLVEGKNNGIDVINEMRRLHGKREWATVQINPKTDKVSRLKSVQSAWSGEYKKDPVTGEGNWVGGIIYAPDKDFADLAIGRVSVFPNSPRKGIVDTASQAVKWLRDNSHILTPEEHQDDLDEEMSFKPMKKPVYDV